MPTAECFKRIPPPTESGREALAVLRIVVNRAVNMHETSLSDDGSGDIKFSSSSRALQCRGYKNEMKLAGLYICSTGVRLDVSLIKQNTVVFGV
jgi:hypothetical protein